MDYQNVTGGLKKTSNRNREPDGNLGPTNMEMRWIAFKGKYVKLNDTEKYNKLLNTQKPTKEKLKMNPKMTKGMIKINHL